MVKKNRSRNDEDDYDILADPAIKVTKTSKRKPKKESKTGSPSKQTPPTNTNTAKKSSSSDDEEEDGNDDEEDTITATTPPSKMSQIKCRKCQQLGHVSNKCPNRNKKMKCFVCGSPDHTRAQCPGIDDGGTGQSKFKGKSSKHTRGVERGADTLSIDLSDPPLYYDFIDASSSLHLLFDSIKHSSFSLPEFIHQQSQQAPSSSTSKNTSTLTLDPSTQHLQLNPYPFPSQHLKRVICNISDAPTLFASNASRLFDCWNTPDNLDPPLPSLTLSPSPASASASEGLRKLKSDDTHPIYFTFGLNPQSANLYSDTFENRLECELLVSPKCKALGLVGLDFSLITNSIDKSQQIKALSSQIRLALKLNLPICLTCVDSKGSFEASDTLLELLTMINEEGEDEEEDENESVSNEKLKISLLSSNPTLHFKLRQLFKVNFFSVFNGALTFTKSSKSLLEIVFDAPLSSLLVSSSAPFMVPSKLSKLFSEKGSYLTIGLNGGKASSSKPSSGGVQYSSPGDCSFVIEKICDVKRTGLEEVFGAILENTKRFYCLE